MKTKKVAFTYNVRHCYPDPENITSQLETDFDDPQTIEHIIRHLEKCGYDVLAVEANQEAYLVLHERRAEIDIVFNYAMGMYGSARYAQLPAMLEMLRLPYTGSDPLTQALILNKAKMQEVLASSGIPVLESQIFYNSEQKLEQGLAYPLIVKPLAQGSSAGITSKSIVNNEHELVEQLNKIISTFKEPALVQPFLTGREFSVPMLGNPPTILPIIEPDFSKVPEGYAHLDSLEVKWVFEEQTDAHHLVCPAILDEETKNQIEFIARKTWDVLQIRDWCRIDMRCDQNGDIYVLDVNSPPGIIPPEISETSYFPMACRAAGINYTTLLTKIIDTACDRYNLYPHGGDKVIHVKEI